MKPDLIIKSIIPVVMSGILGIYGLIMGVLLKGKIGDDLQMYAAYSHLAAGLSVGFSALGAGAAIGAVGEAGVKANAQQEAIFVGMILILIFAEAVALFGLISAILISR